MCKSINQGCYTYDHVLTYCAVILVVYASWCVILSNATQTMSWNDKHALLLWMLKSVSSWCKAERLEALSNCMWWTLLPRPSKSTLPDSHPLQMMWPSMILYLPSLSSALCKQGSSRAGSQLTWIHAETCWIQTRCP